MNYLFKIGRGVALSFAAMGAMVLPSTGHADASRLTMGYIDRTVGARQLATEDYAGTVEVLSPASLLQSKYERATNLCVANTMLDLFSKAEPHCSRARHYAKSESSIQMRGLTARDRRALARNNLGVLRVLQGRHEEAVGLFIKAAPRDVRALHNVTALEQAVSPEDREGLAVMSPPSAF